MQTASRIAIVHKRQGIFVFHDSGRTFWSEVDIGYQEECYTFESLEAAQVFAAEIEVDGVDFVPVSPSHGEHATVDDLALAGLRHCLGRLMSATLH